MRYENVPVNVESDESEILNDFKLPEMGRRSKLPRCVRGCLTIVGILLGLTLLFGFAEWMTSPDPVTKKTLEEARKAHKVLENKPAPPDKKQFLNKVMTDRKKKGKVGKKLYMMYVGEQNSGKTLLSLRFTYGPRVLQPPWQVKPSKGLRKFPSGWKREATCVYEYPAKSGQYRMGTRRIYDYDAHGALVVVDSNQPIHQILEQARRWRKYVRDVKYSEPRTDPEGNLIKDEFNQPIYDRINIPLYLVLTKSDLRGPLTPDEKKQLFELMTEKQEYKIIRNGGVVTHTRDRRGFSGYSDWFYLSARITEGPKKDMVDEKLYAVLNAVGNFQGWADLPPKEEITKEKAEL